MLLEKELFPLSKVNGVYFVNSKCNFKGDILLSEEYVKEVLQFSWQMTWGECGMHRPYRSGGSQHRSNFQLFQDVFVGKCGEFAVVQKIRELGLTTSSVDLKTHGLGVWDNMDLEISGKSVNVKTSKHFSNLLLLEYQDYKINGLYLGHTAEKKKYDYFIFARLKSSLREFFNVSVTRNRNFASEIEFKHYANELLEMKWMLDIPGFVPNSVVQEAISSGHILNRGDYLNRTRMDASNIYIQSGCLSPLDEMIKYL